MEDCLRVFVIIVTFNDKFWYKRCFSSLKKSVIPLSIVVIDNASEDDTVKLIKQDFPDILLFPSGENLGFGKANNIGIKYALEHNCDYVFLLNQDTWIEPNSIADLIKIHLKHKEYGILSPMHIKADGKSLYIQIEDGRKDHGNQLLSDCYFNTLRSVYPFSYINAAAWLIPRDTILTVGGFNPLFTHYEEDDDYLNRLHYHGLKLGLCPTVRIVHDHQNVRPTIINDEVRRYQMQLVSFLDPNKKPSLAHHLFHLCIKVLKALCTGKLSVAKSLVKEFFYFAYRRRRISSSRSKSGIKQTSWL